MFPNHDTVQNPSVREACSPSKVPAFRSFIIFEEELIALAGEERGSDKKGSGDIPVTTV